MNKTINHAASDTASDIAGETVGAAQVGAAYPGPPSFYGWLVHDDLGEPVTGPDTISDTLRGRLLCGHGEVFRCGYRGSVGGSFEYGRYLGPTDQRYRPLIDVSFPVAGSAWIEYALGEEPGERWIRQSWAWRTRAGLACAWRTRRYLLRRARNHVLHRLGRHLRHIDHSTGRTLCWLCDRDLTPVAAKGVAR